MPELPSCFGEHGVQVADSTGTTATSSSGSSSRARTPQNTVVCVYMAKLVPPAEVTVTWCKSLVGPGLSVDVEGRDGAEPCKVDMKPWHFWKRKKGCKSFGSGVTVVWDLSAAKYGLSSAEPIGGFFIAVFFRHNLALVLGDTPSEAIIAKSPVTTTAATLPSQLPPPHLLVSRTEHISGKNFYTAKAQFGDSTGPTHDIAIECHIRSHRDSTLSISIDRRLAARVNRLAWNFRGNQTIVVDGLPIELFWDVFNWLFDSSQSSAAFLFRNRHHQMSRISKGNIGLPGFTLMLYAWRIE